MAVLKNVTLAYVKLQSPVQKFETEGHQNTEWSVDCVISKEDAKRWKTQFKKQPPREHTNEEFKKIFRIDPPFPDQEDQYVVKVKKDTHFKDRETQKLTPFEAKHRPKLFEKIGERDGKPLLSDITKTKLVSNGSKGVVMYDIVTNKYGTFAKLKAVRVDDLIEYNAGSSVDELGEVVDGDVTMPETDEDFGSDMGEEEAPFEPDTDY